MSHQLIAAFTLAIAIATVFPAVGKSQVGTLFERQPPEQPSQLPEPERADSQLRVHPSCASRDQLGESLRAMREVSLDIGPSAGRLPEDCFAQHFPNATLRGRVPRLPRGDWYFDYHWGAPGVTSNPLYFEDVALERYGQGYSPVVQPFVSSARFVSQAVFLPYQMGLDAPYELVYRLGYDRPGNATRSVRSRLPWSWKGAALQAGAVTGGAYLFP